MDWHEPMQAPAIAAATQNCPVVVASAAMIQVITQPTSVLPSVSLWPMRSCR